MKKLLTEWRKYLKEEDEMTKWYHGSRQGLSQDLKSLYLTPSEALASLHGKVYEFSISPDAKWLNLSKVSMGPMAMVTMDSVGYKEKQMELIRAEGFDIVWDSGDYARGNEQIFVLNPEMASVVEQQSREQINK